MDGIADKVKQALAILWEAACVVGRVAAKACDLVHAAETVARRYRWCLSTSWPPALVMELGQMADEGASLADFEARILRFYEANDYRELGNLVEATCDYQSVAPRRKRILREGVIAARALRAAGCNPATWLLPRLFVEFEGILRDYVRADVPTLSAQNASVREMIKTLRPFAAAVERPALHVISAHLYRNTRRKQAKHVRVSRHLHLHGLTRMPATMPSTIRVLLMLDLVAYLIDRRRGVDLTGRVEMRATWADILGRTATMGKKFREIRGGPIPPLALPSA